MPYIFENSEVRRSPDDPTGTDRGRSDIWTVNYTNRWNTFFLYLSSKLNTNSQARQAYTSRPIQFSFSRANEKARKE